MQPKVIHLKLKPSLAAKLGELAELSRRTMTDVIRILIRDAKPENLGLKREE